MYSVAEWEELADSRDIGRAELESWLDKAYATAAGKKWLDDRNRNLNKTCDPADVPDFVKVMWDAHNMVQEQASHLSHIQKGFNQKYKCMLADRSRPEISVILRSEEVYSWRGGAKPHIFMYFLFDAIADMPVKAQVLQENVLSRIFDPLLGQEFNSSQVFVRSGAVLFRDAAGFHATLLHIETRTRTAKRRLWNWHVVHYVPSREDGFPEPELGSSYVVYMIFCFAYSPTQSPKECFGDFFAGKRPFDAVYLAKDITETIQQWRRPGRPTIKVAALSTIFQQHIKDNMVLVNVNGGAHFTLLGLVSTLSAPFEC